MVREQERPLDRQRHRNNHLLPHSLHNQPMPLRLHPHVLPHIRRLPLRRQRPLPLRLRLRRHFIRKTHVSKTRDRQRRQPARGFECLRYRKLRPFGVGGTPELIHIVSRLGCGCSTSTVPD